jgi:hypothetical protein
MKSLLNFRLSVITLVLVPLLLLAAACASSAPEELDIPVTLEGGKLNPETIQVGQGDTVTLRIEADEPGEVHLHGYDIETEVGAEAVTALTFIADATGRFRITFHSHSQGHDTSESHGEGSGGQAEAEEMDVGFLEVRPR